MKSKSEVKTIKLLYVDEERCTHCNMCNIVLPGFFKMYHGHLVMTQEQFDNKLMQERIKTMTGICLEQAFILEDLTIDGG